MKKKRFSDLVIGIAFMALGVAVLLMASSLHRVKLGIGPGGFPTFIAVLMTILGAAQVFSTLRAGLSAPRFTADRRQVLLFLGTVGAAVLYVLTVPKAGFLLATPVLLFVVMMLYGNRRYLRCIAVSIVASAVVWVLFTRVFMIFLPPCRLFR